ncbi:MAG: cyclase family protein, partial [Actinobacteria bacterium]|nr:cyclase family protein [Actinomycetota bacterium]
MITYPGLPAPTITDHMTFAQSSDRYGKGTEFRIGRIEMVANTGTYLDTPAHRYRDGIDLAMVGLGAFADLPGLVVSVDGFAIDHVPTGDLEGKAVLFSTGWSRHWGTETYGAVEHPHLTQGAALALANAGVGLVGIDSVNIDSTTNGERP